MAIYSYVCDTCGNVVDVERSMKEDDNFTNSPCSKEKCKGKYRRNFADSNTTIQIPPHMRAV